MEEITTETVVITSMPKENDEPKNEYKKGHRRAFSVPSTIRKSDRNATAHNTIEESEVTY